MMFRKVYMKVGWKSVSLLMLGSLPLLGQSPSQQRFEITTRQIVQALSDKGIHISEKQVSLVASVVSTRHQPLLDILSIEPISGPLRSTQKTEIASWVKVACHQPNVCLPFYVVVSGLAVSVGNVKGSGSADNANGMTPESSKSDVTMRAGAHAILVLDDNRSHLQLSVITLESGTAGHMIRVTSPDRKHVYSAEIVSEKVLKGSF